MVDIAAKYSKSPLNGKPLQHTTISFAAFFCSIYFVHDKSKYTFFDNNNNFSAEKSLQRSSGLPKILKSILCTALS